MSLGTHVGPNDVCLEEEHNKNRPFECKQINSLGCFIREFFLSLSYNVRTTSTEKCIIVPFLSQNYTYVAGKNYKYVCCFKLLQEKIKTYKLKKCDNGTAPGKSVTST